jgi:NAD-dependent histone deacetylase SIR2
MGHVAESTLQETEDCCDRRRWHFRLCRQYFSTHPPRRSEFTDILPVPDFRSSTGLFKTLKGQHNLKSSGKDLFDASVYKDDKSTSSFHEMVRNLATATKAASATPFHHLLATLANEGRLLRLYTQNVDGIDTSLPPLATQIPLQSRGPWPKTVQLHGSLEHMVCTKCHVISPLDPELFKRDDPPPCGTCVETDGVRTQHAGKRSHGVGRLRPRMVLYNEHNPDDEAIGAVAKADMRTRPDALIVVGTTLKVPGVKRIVKEMCQLVRDRRDGMTIWINNDPPPLGKDYEWDLAVQGPCDVVASKAAMPKWDDVYEEVSDAQLQKVKKEAGTIEVVVLSPSKNKNKLVDKISGHITPLPSPRLAPQQADKKPNSKTAMVKPKIAIKVSTKKTGIKIVKPPLSGKAKKLPVPKNKKSNVPFKIPTQPTITLKFTQSKAGAQPISTAETKAKPQSSGKKAEVSQAMQPVSPSAARNNSNPPFKPHGPSKKPYADAKGVPLTVDIPGEIGRVGESPEERKRIISPTGPVPNSLRSILNYE